MGAYAIWKFREAASSLASGDADLRTRLRWATVNFGPVVSPRDFPNAELAARYDELHAMLTAVKDGPVSEGQYANTIAAMSDQEAREAADKIVDLAFSLWPHET